ncbi:MAG: hypothetical protein ABS903_18235 [Solibacillus sp.]
MVVGDFIGTIKQKVDIEKRPTANLTSNYLNEGIKIYSVAGYTEVFLAKKDNGVFEVFK